MSSGAAPALDPLTQPPQTVKELVAQDGDVLAQVAAQAPQAQPLPGGGTNPFEGVRDEDYRFQPRPYEPAPQQGFWSSVVDGVSLAGSVQGLERTREMLMPAEEGYDPLKDPRLKGNERYAPWLREARSRSEFGAMLERFGNNEQAAWRLSENGSLWTGLVAGLLDPANALIPGVSLGRGLARGALSGLAAGGAAGLADIGARAAVDPAYDRRTGMEELFYATALGSVLGGLHGGLAGLGEFHPTVERFGRTMMETQERLDAELEAQAVAGVSNTYVPRPSDGSEGIKPTGLGLENVIGGSSVANPFATAWGWLVQSGNRALQDFANMMGGDLGLTLNDNVAGRATPPSAWLYAGRWNALAADTLGALEREYAAYLGKADPLHVAGLNVTTTGARLGGVLRRALRRGRADGKMEFDQWLEAIFHAHQPDGIRPDLDLMARKGWDASEAAGGSVSRGAGIVRRFFDEADKEARTTGFYGRHYGQILDRRFRTYEDNEAKISGLLALPERTPQQEAQLVWRMDRRDRLKERIPEQAWMQREYEGMRVRWEDLMRNGQRPTRRWTDEKGKEHVKPGDPEMDRLHALMRELELKGIGQRTKANPPVKGSISNPDTDARFTGVAANDPKAGPRAEVLVNGEPVSVAEAVLMAANDDLNHTPHPAGVVPGDVPAHLRDQFGLLPEHELVAGNDNQDLGGPKSDPHYLTRRWDMEAVRTDPEGLRAAFDRWHDAQGKARLTAEEFDGIRDAILKGQEGGQERMTGSPVGGLFRKGRQLDIPNAYVADFVERNVGSLVRDYSHRFGAGLEVHKMFGERDAADAIDEAILMALGERQGTTEDLLAFGRAAQERMQYLRDQTLGDLHVQDPLSMGKVGAETMKAWASTAMLGKVVFSQLVETARPLMTHGFQRNFGFITDTMIGNLAGFKQAGKDLRSLVGEAIDVSHGSTGARLMEFGDLSRPGSTLAQRTRAGLQPFLSFANGPWYLLNLMGPVTDLTKNYVMVMGSHFLIEDMRRLVDGRAGAQTVERLAALGVDLDGAKAMLAQPMEKSGRLNVANLAQWDDQLLARRFAAAIRGDVNRVITTPSPQTKSALSQGFLQYGDGRRQWAMVTLPMQFMSWGFAAAQKISMSALQGRDANAMSGIAALTAAAYLSQWLKTDGAAWDRTPVSERVLKAVDQSGALALVGNFNTMLEAVSMGHAGVRPWLGMDPAFGHAPDGYDAVGVGLGPAGGQVLQLWRAFADPSLEDWQKAGIVRRAVPAAGLFYVDGLAKGVQKMAVDP